MSEFRRRLMMTGGGSSSPYDEYGYIADGKIFHLDGISKGNTAGAWTDLIGGLVFQNGGNVTELTNGWSFTGGHYGTLYNNLYNSNMDALPENENSTVEFCADIQNTRYSMLITKMVRNIPVIYVNNSVVTFLQYQNTYRQSSNNGKHCYSYNLDQGCEDGVSVTKNSGTDWWGNNNYFYIGARNNTGEPFKGVLYSIRIYNRRLTLAEQINNQQIDNQRFNLGLTI